MPERSARYLGVDVGVRECSVYMHMWVGVGEGRVNTVLYTGVGVGWEGRKANRECGRCLKVYPSACVSIVYIGVCLVFQLF